MMNNVLVILQKEWLEIRQQRGLLFTMLLPPLLFTLLPVGILYATAHITANSSTSNQSFSNPLLAGMSSLEIGQAVTGLQFSIMYLLIPLLIPSIVAAYSIIGEKTSHTLEPVLATPVQVWELLVGKSLIALLPAVITTWLSGGVFIIAVAAFAVSQRVFTTIVSPGWLIAFLLWTPLLGLIAIAVMVAISSRVNDPRTAQQFAAWVVVPFLVLIFGQLSGLVILGPVLALSVLVVLALLAVLAIWVATKIFQREVILTRWK
jgi:ABC-2 type transport system permease protein